MSEYAVGSIKALPRYIQVHRQDNESMKKCGAVTECIACWG